MQECNWTTGCPNRGKANHGFDYYCPFHDVRIGMSDSFVAVEFATMIRCCYTPREKETLDYLTVLLQELYLIPAV